MISEYIYFILFINNNYLIENESEVIYHPEAYYISRKIDYTNKINEILAQNELSDKIEILDDNIDDNDSLGMYKKKIHLYTNYEKKKKVVFLLTYHHYLILLENYIIEDDYY